MNHLRLICTLLLLSSLIAAPQARADSELQRLRTQNAQLKAQLQTLQQACPSAASSLATPAAAPPLAAAAPAVTTVAPAVPGTPAPASAAALKSAGATPPPATAPVASATVATPMAPAESIAAAPAAPPPQPPPGYKLVKVDPAASAADAENCQQGLFTNTKDAPWKHEENWRALAKRMLPGAVETTLGSNHTSFTKGARTLWEYGKCGNSSAQASVVFDADGVLFWQQPDF